MADRRSTACRLAVASQWAALAWEATCWAELYSEPGSLLERPTAEARARAKRQHRLQQRRRLQYRRWKATIWLQPEAAPELQGLEVEA
jgi:hypothetical protein